MADLRKNLVRSAVPLAAVPLIAVAVWLAASEASRDRASAVGPASDRPMLLGAGSCAAAACHNGGDVSRLKGREYAICMADKHDRAYAVLFDERSKKIEQRLHGLDDWRIAQPERDVLCLKCHVHPDIATAPIKVVDGIRQFRFEDGVSCEACHGPAERWLDRHHRPSWLALSASEKREHFGMTDTRPLDHRPRACVACHVGAPGMDVNHDLIAAGHPRLAFEFAGYQSLMTRHWDDAAMRKSQPDFESSGWALGQLVALKASLELLRHRLAGPVWPEFAEFDCYACHHDLRNPGTKQDRDFPNRKAGRPTWNRWPIAQTPAALAMLGESPDHLARGLDAIDAEMAKPLPDRAVIDLEIPPLVRKIDEILDKPGRGSIGRGAMALVVRTSPRTWDEAAQSFSALVAVEKDRIDRGSPEIAGLREPLADLRRVLLRDARYRLDDLGPTFARIQKAVLR